MKLRNLKMEVSRNELIQFWVAGGNEEDVKKYLIGKNKNVCVVSAEDIIRVEKLGYITRWKESKRTLSRFREKYEKWLKNKVFFPCKKLKVQQKRPLKLFSDSSHKTKKKRLQVIREKFTTEELAFAAACSARKTGQRITGKLLEEIGKNPTEESLFVSLVRETKEIVAFTPEEALGFIARNDLSKAQYQDIRMTTIKNGAKMYPSYNAVVEAKKSCYPPAGM